MKIGLLFNEQKTIAYMCASISKSKDNCSRAMKQGLKTSIENKCNNNEQMGAIAHVYSSNRECSVQEKIYHC